LLSNKTGQYCIAFQDRSGEVGYFDQKTRKEFLQQPLEMVKNTYLISQFDPSQACYIGLLAGISMEKKIKLEAKGESVKTTKRVSSVRPHLRVVK